MAEIVLWQFRWLNPGDDPNVPPSMLEWQEVKPWNPRMQTLEQRIEELRSFRYNGKPVYEVRALGVIPCVEVDRDSDGELLIDWSPGKGRMLSMTLRSDGRLSYAFTWDGERAHGIAQMPPPHGVTPTEASSKGGRIGQLAAACGVNPSPKLGWCEHCGEGVTDFCRGKTDACPKGLKQPGTRGVVAAPAPEVTDAMVDAYLRANDAYWKRTDELPTPPDKWRTGTPREATRESLRAALGVRVPDDDWPPQAMKDRLNAARERAAADYHEGRERLANTLLTGEDDAPPAA